MFRDRSRVAQRAGSLRAERWRLSLPKRGSCVLWVASVIRPLPVLIADANRLRDFYVEVGAVYEGEEATTVLPPPIPAAPGVPTNVGMSVGDDGRILDHVG